MGPDRARLAAEDARDFLVAQVSSEALQHLHLPFAGPALALVPDDRPGLGRDERRSKSLHERRLLLLSIVVQCMTNRSRRVFKKTHACVTPGSVFLALREPRHECRVIEMKKCSPR